jgi:Flp pilus assembly protein protease CpaA
MEFGFLFWLFFCGIVVASMQDLKRREVDNWLNLFLLISSFAYVFYGAVLVRDFDVIFHAGFLLVVMFLVMNLFYYGRVFAGGDAKLLFSMTVFFMGATFFESVINIGIFALFLMISGSIYGLAYSGFLWFNNRKKVNIEMRRQMADGGWRMNVGVGLGVFLMLLGFTNFLFFLVGILLFIFPFLYVFAKGLENVSMIREVSGKELREGDWLVKDVVLRKSEVGGRRVIKADWNGLSLEDIELLKRRRKVLIKEGLPFVPAFLFAFWGYVFLRGWFGF